MPTPVKPCEGKFSEELQVVLSKNRDRAQWATYSCEVCGALVGAVQLQGKWVPEQHWPTVKYPARTPVDKRRYSREHPMPEVNDDGRSKSAFAQPERRGELTKA